MQYAFGSGQLYGVSSTANATPVKFGALQNVNVEFNFSNKELFGQYTFALAVGRGNAKVSGKAQFAQINANAFNSLFLGGTQSTGKIATINDETGTVPTTPFQITVANGATFLDDLGVRNASTGIELTKVASAPATGQYSVSGSGVYTFASADTGISVLISYNYNVAASGKKIVIANQLVGVAPTFMVSLNVPFNGKTMNVKLNSCVSGKMSFGTKIDDFVIPEFDFMAQADASNNIGTISLDE